MNIETPQEPATPIADLSYRNYDGPKKLSAVRWLPILRNGIRMTMKKKAFWVLTFLAASPYLFLIFVMFLSDTFAGEVGGSPLGNFPGLLVNAFGNWFWVLLVALLVGTGSIAADNRANALQVYLSKPITKSDYLIGKLASVFVVIYGIVLLPLIMVTTYAAFSTGLNQFISENPLLVPKLFVLAAVPALLHSCLLTGISAWNKTPWLVGVIYAGVFFFGNLFATILGEVMRERAEPVLAETVQHLSLSGLISGLGANLIGEAAVSIQDLMREPVMPNWVPLAALFVALCAVGVLLAAVRIRAVEVVHS